MSNPRSYAELSQQQMESFLIRFARENGSEIRSEDIRQEGTVNFYFDVNIIDFKISNLDS